MSRTNVSMHEDVYARLAALKREDESWTDLGERAADALEAQETTGRDGEGDVRVLTEEHIQDIAAQTAERTAREVENRLTTR